MNTNAIRKKILDLAIRGKLVPQDPNDEPASVLLERIRAEKERLVKEGKIKRDKKDSDTSCDDKPHYGKLPFELPDGWAWCRLSSIATFAGGKTPAMENHNYWNGNVNWVTSKDMKSKDIYYTQIKMSELGAEQMQIFEPNTLLIVVRSGILRRTFPLAILRTNSTVNQDLKAVSFYVVELCEYVYYFLSAIEQDILSKYKKHGTTVESINVDEFKDMLIPLPPLAEQHRIVVAIESAFTVIDEIERNKTDLQAAVTAAKSKILDFAIRGKLVPQDPADEPADVLLERIRAEKETLIKSGKIKRGKDESALKECCDNSYYTVLPKSWSVCRLGDIIRLISGVSYAKNDVATDGIRILRGGNIQDDKILLLEDDVFLPYTYYDDDKVVRTTDTVIVASTGSKAVIGKAGFTQLINENIQIGAFLRIVRPYLEETTRFVQLLFRSDYYRNYIRDISKGTNINNIKAEYITDFVIALPPLAEQHRITIAIESAFKQLDDIAINLL